MEHQLYHTMLLLAGSVNIIIAVVLLYNNAWFRNYDVYRRARQLVALCYFIFAIGFIIHAQFQWRTSWPAGASALSVNYFHIGAVLFGWSHTSLMRPDYLTRHVFARDIIILLIGLTAYWLPFAINAPQLLTSHSSLLTSHFSLRTLPFAIFFAHATFIAYIFYHTYFTVRRSLMQMPADENAPYWWTPEAKRTVLNGHHSFMIACHLIVLFGIGSIVVTVAFPTQITPYTLLISMGIGVYCYIFYAITEYGNVIEAATCATEDAEEVRSEKLEVRSWK